jgi:hypothetical protein
MVATVADVRVELVDDSTTGDLREQVLRLWATHGVLDGSLAVDRLGAVVCVLVDGAGIVVGTCSAVDTPVPLVGGRRFWSYRRFLASDVDEESEAALFTFAFDALQRRAAGPIGVCVVLDDLDSLRRRPEAVWPDTGLFHAGYLEDGRPIRLRYFADAVIA